MIPFQSVELSELFEQFPRLYGAFVELRDAWHDEFANELATVVCVDQDGDGLNMCLRLVAGHRHNGPKSR